MSACLIFTAVFIVGQYTKILLSALFVVFNFDVQTNINLLKERYRGFKHALKSQAT